MRKKISIVVKIVLEWYCIFEYLFTTRKYFSGRNLYVCVTQCVVYELLDLMFKKEQSFFFIFGFSLFFGNDMQTWITISDRFM